MQVVDFGCGCGQPADWYITERELVIEYGSPSRRKTLRQAIFDKFGKIDLPNAAKTISCNMTNNGYAACNTCLAIALEYLHKNRVDSQSVFFIRKVSDRVVEIP